MTSDGVDAQTDVDRLISTALQLGRTRLAEAAGSIRSRSCSTPMADCSRRTSTRARSASIETEDVIAATITQLRLARASARATAIVINTRLSKERTDAIEVRLEHSTGMSLVVLLRYKRATFGGRTEYDAPAVYSATPAIWV